MPRYHAVHALVAHHELAAQEDAADGLVPGSKGIEAGLRRVAPGRADVGDPPAIGRRLDAPRQRASADRVDDDVRAAPARQLAHGRDEVARAIVDAVVEAERLQPFEL